jgi:hypothetical protein
VKSFHELTRFTYTFQNHFHPFVGDILARLNRESIRGVMDPAWQDGLAQTFFDAVYHPANSRVLSVGSSPKEMDYSAHGPYAAYNWELFYHIPLAIAVHLSKTRRYPEAQRWFHYIFDPTSNDRSVDPPQRFWKLLPFRKEAHPHPIDYRLTLLSRQPSELSLTDQALRADTLNGYRAILDNPFQPWAVARTRHLAYQYCVVMKYLDNLIAWGDDLFQQDTLESINEATQVYVLASNILGPRPQRIPQTGTVQPKTYAQLKKAGLDALGNALVDLESQFPFNFGTGAGATDGDSSSSLLGLGTTLYFCIPQNQKLLGYWDTVADRLYKVRHCMNIAGVVRPLALYDPPIDPGMMVRAAAAGLDINSIVAGLNQPIGPVRALPMLTRALELCAELRSFGGALLQAFEQGDAEHLAVLRQGHEVAMQQANLQLRSMQIRSAQETTNSLLTARGMTLEQLNYYQRLLGLQDDPNKADVTMEQLTASRDSWAGLTDDNFDEIFGKLVTQYDVALTHQDLPDYKPADASEPGIVSGFSGTGNLHLSKNEDTELNVHLPLVRDAKLLAAAANTVAAALMPIPSVHVHEHFWGIGASEGVTSGQRIAAISKFVGDIASILGTWEQDQAVMAGMFAGHERRADEWLLQYNRAARELKQNGRQILTSLLAEQAARKDYAATSQALANAQEANTALQTKFTKEDLHVWMQGELSKSFYDFYRFTFDFARRTQLTVQRELMRPEIESQDFIKFNYWDAGHQGLLAGEALYADLKRLEIAYHDNNKRELEMLKHVSLRQLDPVQLLVLRATGSCTLDIPEWHVDQDCPGQYMRRIKSVALSIPSVTGPYTSVNCTLTLLRSSVRKSADGDYARQGSDDDRFVDYAGAAQSVVTSSATNDSGTFETNLRDDRFLPFEGAGVISTWKLDLPGSYRAFDYSTIADVILHLRYTARLGVNPAAVKTSLDDVLSPTPTGPGANAALFFSLSKDFPTEWSAFLASANDFSATITRDYFPYFTQGRPITILGTVLYASDPGKHHEIGDPAAATAALADNSQFPITAAPDTPGPSQVLIRAEGTPVYAVVRYALG